MKANLKEGLQDSLEFNQWVNDILAEIRVVLEDDSERSEKLIASDIKDDPFEKHEQDIEEMFMNNVDPSEAANIILDIMFKEIDNRIVRENLNERGGASGIGDTPYLSDARAELSDKGIQVEDLDTKTAVDFLMARILQLEEAVLDLKMR